MPAGLPAKMAVLLRAPAGLIIRVTLDELMTHKHSDYMHWSKTQSRARFNLATSGVASFPLRELPVELDTLEINGYDGYGYPLLQKPSPRITVSIRTALWNPQELPWQIILPWLRSSNRGTKS